ncbi:MAG: sulfatase [Cyclobacteriaceae bacterium]|nr:sulfatase [Cyclobacteriaceae bacterium]
MIKKATFLCLALACLWHLSPVAYGQQQHTDALPNILLILSDDHSYPYLSCYGNEALKTPNLDGLASEGLLFTNAYTTASQCVPSRASILSGRNVIDIKMTRFSAPLPREVKTIPDYLRAQGYYTGICGRHYHLDGSGRMPQETADAFEKYKLVTFPDRVDYLKVGSDAEVIEQFREFLDQAPAEKPFFMWMNYSDPHRPFTAKAFEPDPGQLTVPSGMPDHIEVRKDLAGHFGEINRLDVHIGQVLEELEKRSLKPNTMVIFMGDNGAALLRGKGTLYDLGIHVPLILRYPGRIDAGKTTGALVSGIDVLPTILEAAGLSPDKEVSGKSFLHVLQPHTFKAHEYIFAQRGPHGSGLPLQSAYFDLIRTVFDHHYKLIYHANWQVPYAPVDFNSSKMWHELALLHDQGQLPVQFSRAFFLFHDLCLSSTTAKTIRMNCTILLTMMNMPGLPISSKQDFMNG